MFKGFKPTSFFLPAAVLALVGCDSIPPHIEDWDRTRITEIPKSAIEVAICFEHSQHTKEQVYAIAREECAVRITEVEKLVQHKKLQEVTKQTDIDPRLLQGPVARQKAIDAMISSMSLKYIENDKWDCPLLTPNRIMFQCQYDKNAQDSVKTQQPEVHNTPSPELPPELPDDLKPN